MSQRLYLFAGEVLTLDRSRPIKDGFVLVQGHRILQVGRREDLHLSPNARFLDLGGTVLMPGFINAHTHLEYTSFKGAVRHRGDFRDWLRRMGRKSAQTPASEFRRSVAAGIKESISRGTTTLCDISHSGASWSLLRRSGLRAFVFHELLDLAQSSPAAYWRSAQEKIHALLRESPTTPTFRWGLAPHTPFTVSKELLNLVNRYLDSRPDIPTTIHVGESREEGRYFGKGTGPMSDRIKVLNPDWNQPRNTTPVQYLNGCGWLPKLDIAVHLNVVDAKDVRLLARNRIAVVHCPGSHAFFGHPPFKTALMRRHGVDLCLGTDSLASNSSLSLFREMRLFRKAHPAISGREVLSMVTVHPARALGFGNQLGRIKPGYLADLIGIPMPKGGGQGKKTLEDRVIGYRGAVSFAMVNGELLFR